MAGSISINLQAISASGGQSNSDRGNSTTIEGLKKKIAALNQDLKSALNEKTEAGAERAKNIQIQIQMAQMQLNQLTQQEAEKKAKDQQASSNGGGLMHVGREKSNSLNLIDIYA